MTAAQSISYSLHSRAGPFLIYTASLQKEPATYNIDALEDSELILINRTAHYEMLEMIPKYQSYILHLITGAYLAMTRRLTSVISNSSEERYETISELNPDILQRVPQHMIASYMGLKPETLSSVRKKLFSNRFLPAAILTNVNVIYC